MNCDWCGGNRSETTERFSVAFSDFTDATADYAKYFLCASCWRHHRDRLERGAAI